MALRNLPLVLVSFWIWQLTQLSTASQDWISLRGCYNYIHTTESVIPFNEPQACFDRCPNSTAVGLKNSTCICYQSYSYSGQLWESRCNLKCPGKSWLYCGAESGSNSLVSVYSKDPPQTNDINVNTDYGFVSVSISPSGDTYHTSNNNSTPRNGYICYDDFQARDPCHRFDKAPGYTWEEASEECRRNGQVLISLSNIPLCEKRTLFGGIFWIGLYRNSPGSQVITASQHWITLRGCYNYIHTTESIIPFNEPQACFDRCPNSTAVGLKNTTCICYQSYSYSGQLWESRCNLKCPGKSWLYCGAESGSNSLVSVYSKDPPQTNDINVNTDYGFVSVSISPSGDTYHASNNNSTPRNGYICYDDFQARDPCHRFDKAPGYTWEEASEECRRNGQVLISLSNIPLCEKRTLFGGIFWIGLYRNVSGSATPTTTSTSSASTSTKPTISTFTSTITPATTTKHASVSNLGLMLTSSVTETGSSVDGIKAVYVAVPVVAVVLAMVVFALVSWKRKCLCFKPRHNRLTTNVLENSILAKYDVSQATSTGKYRNGKHKSEVDSKNISPQLDAGNYISAHEGDRISDGIQTGILQKAEIANECIDRVEEGVDVKNGEKRTKGKRRHGKTKKKKHKKHRQRDYPGQADIQIENNREDHDIHADINNKDQFNTTCISELYSQAENVESHGESKRKHKKGNRKDKKRSYEEGLVEDSEGAQYNIRNPVRNSDRYAENYLGATSVNVMLPQAENENKQEDDRRTQRKKSRREKRTRKKENFCDDTNEPGNLEINAE